MHNESGVNSMSAHREFDAIVIGSGMGGVLPKNLVAFYLKPFGNVVKSARLWLS
jgi:hypothetical protein